MGLTVSERKALIRKHAKRYRKSTKKQKARCLIENLTLTNPSVWLKQSAPEVRDGVNDEG